jgi:hypothetical protein
MRRAGEKCRRCWWRPRWSRRCSCSGVGGGIAYATGEAEDRATGPGLEKAKGAALEHTSGGRVTGTEVGDEEGFYEIEITRDDGSQLDVHLDRDLDVLGTPVDHENLDDGDGANDE